MKKRQTNERTVITTETHEVWVVRSPNGEVLEYPTNSGNVGLQEILQQLQDEKNDDDVTTTER